MTAKTPSNLQYIVDNAQRLADAGVCVLEVGDGANRVRVEFARLTRSGDRGIVPESVPGASSDVDHERAGADPARSASEPTGDEAAEQDADRDLDLAHLDDADAD